MQNIVFNNFLSVLIFLYIVCFSIYVFIRFMRYLEEKNKLKKIELENNKYDLFMRMDPKLAEKGIVLNYRYSYIQPGEVRFETENIEPRLRIYFYNNRIEIINEKNYPYPMFVCVYNATYVHNLIDKDTTGLMLVATVCALVTSSTTSPKNTKRTRHATNACLNRLDIRITI